MLVPLNIDSHRTNHVIRAELQAIDPDARVVLTGSAVVRHEQLIAIMRALFVALPISVILCLVLAGLFMRSLRLAIASVVPILVVVAWLYAFMHLAGYGINVVTATIGAVSIGIQSLPDPHFEW